MHLDNISEEKKMLEEKGISLRDHILEEVKGIDSPLKANHVANRQSNKFSPSKTKYMTHENKDKLPDQQHFQDHIKKIGDSSDSDCEDSGFRLHKMADD